MISNQENNVMMKVSDRSAVVIAEILEQQQLSVKFQPTQTHTCMHPQ